MVTKIITTNCFVQKDGKLLLGMKKRDFGQGRWNGFGGKVLPGEPLIEAARREMFEECGITVGELELIGTMDFEYKGKDKVMEVNIFRITDYVGDPTETEEMKPQWFAFDEIPLDCMWPDDTHWMPLFLQGKKFKGNFLFEGYATIAKFNLDEVK